MCLAVYLFSIFTKLRKTSFITPKVIGYIYTFVKHIIIENNVQNLSD